MSLIPLKMHNTVEMSKVFKSHIVCNCTKYMKKTYEVAETDL